MKFNWNLIMHSEIAQKHTIGYLSQEIGRLMVHMIGGRHAAWDIMNFLCLYFLLESVCLHSFKSRFFQLRMNSRWWTSCCNWLLAKGIYGGINNSSKMGLDPKGGRRTLWLIYEIQQRADPGRGNTAMDPISFVNYDVIYMIIEYAGFQVE